MKNKFHIILASGLVFSGSLSFAQNNVGIGTTTPDPTSILEMKASDKGVLVPRMTTTQRQAIANPAEALMVYDTDAECFYYFKLSSGWMNLCSSMTGPVGPQGPTGLTGPQGPAGTNGIDGVDGATGATGPQGPQGPQGPAGPAGTNGIDGVDGAVGATGPQGPQGPQGPSGTNGIDGVDGAVGATGPQGLQGPQGPAGTNGIDGVDGAVGATGPQGPIGLTGATGPQGPIGLTGATGATGATGPTWTISSDNFNTDGSLAIVTSIPSTITSTNAAWICGTSAATTNATTGTRFLGTSTNQHMDLVSNGLVRGRLSSLGEFFIGTTSTSLPGDLMNGVGNAAFPWAVNGYTTQDAGATYGLRQAGAIGAWGSVQGETVSTISANNSGVSGLAAANNHRGVTGQKPAGGVGFGGLFLNDLGYSGTLVVVSDGRTKKNITEITGALDKVMKLRGTTYQYKDQYQYYLGGSSTYYGFIAQELEEVFPEMVYEKDITPPNTRAFKTPETDLGKVKTVSLVSMVPVLVEAIKEQQAQIEELKKEIDILKQKQ